MPYVSLAQEGFMHEHPEVLGKKGLKEWDSATKGMHLPKHVHAVRTAPPEARHALVVNHKHLYHNKGDGTP